MKEKFSPVIGTDESEALKSLYRSPGNKKKPIGPLQTLCFLC